jgi:serine/threonine protein kinase
MTDQPKEAYPGIFVSSTDPDLPSWFTNGFEKYTNFKEAGGGGAGMLHSCYDQNLGRTVMIKRLPEQDAKDPAKRKRLLREARVTAQLQHPNTVPVYEIGRDPEGRLYFTMKKIEGQNLFGILSRIARGDEKARAGYPLSTLLEIVTAASNALAYAHAHGVIHRDVKPENIMVGKFGQVALMDWGVAKVWGQSDEQHHAKLSPQEEANRLTQPGSRPGTPLYMSPEQVRGDKFLDERTDVFSMGVLLYEMLALKEPFRGQTIHDTFDNILHETPPPPSEVSRQHFEIPKELDRITMKAMEKRAENRYRKIEEMLEDISAVEHA